MKIDFTRLVMRAVLLGTAGFIALACSASTDSDDEDVGVTSDALGEVGCRTAPKSDDQDPATPHLIQNTVFCLGTGISDSTNTLYGSPTCPNQWLVGYGGFSGNATVTADWLDAPPINGTACQNSMIGLATHTLTTSGWVDGGPVFHKGQWSGGVCTFPTVTLTVGSGSWHRASAVAWRHTGSGLTKANVRVRMSRC